MEVSMKEIIVRYGVNCNEKKHSKFPYSKRNSLNLELSIINLIIKNLS